jgi:ubiquitin-protein ligase E3 C
MFAEELAGNPAKKRADEAKNRRLRAKREKEAKDARKRKELERREASVTAATDNISKDSAGNGDSFSVLAISATTTAPETQGDVLGVTGTVKAPSSTTVKPRTTDTPLTAAQIASEQRKIRAEARSNYSSAVVIQSIIRSKLVSSKARQEQREIFDKRMSDLIALAGILKKSQQNDSDYIPPPATASMMTVQFLFFALPYASGKQCKVNITDGSVILEQHDLSRWAKLVKYVILPGVASDNEDLDALVPWVESVAGKRRLTKILGLCVSNISRQRNVCAVQSKTNNLDRTSLYRSVDSLLRRVLRLDEGAAAYGGRSRDNVHQMAQSLLFQACPPNLVINQSNNNTATTANTGSRCDIVLSLRFVLLYGSDGKSKPIPPNSEQLREKCILQDDKERISILFKLLIDYISSITVVAASDVCSLFGSRFLTEILTVPLLTWKVKRDVLKLITSTPKSKGHPPLIDYIHNFIVLNSNQVSSGSIDVVLNMGDVTLTSCPAPAVLCLLANLIQIGKHCETLNGSDSTKIHYKAAAEYFNFLANLINAAPLGTFCRRMSAVEWVYVGSSSTPIVLSDVVVEQASALLADSYVRTLFRCAIDDNLLGTEKVISTKTDKDNSYEKELDDIGSESAASLAAREAMVDRNRSFWSATSSWGKKLTQSMNALMSTAGEKKPNKPKGPGQLMNTSSISRQLANGKSTVNRAVTTAVLSNSSDHQDRKEESSTAKAEHEYNMVFLASLCKLLYMCLVP